MDRVPSFDDVDLSAVLRISLTAETRQRLDEVGHRIDLLRMPADERGWIIGNGTQAVADGQPLPLPLPLALGTALGRHYEPSDWLELALDVWYAGRGRLRVTASGGGLLLPGRPRHASGRRGWMASTIRDPVAQCARSGT
jgi:hypothetical protein